MRGGTALIQLPLLLDKYLEFLRFQKGLSDHSLKAYHSDLLQVFQLKYDCTFSKKPASCDFWSSVVRKSFRSFQDLKTPSKKRKVSSLKGFADWLKSHHKIELITPEFPSQKSPRKIPHFLSLDECLSLVAHLDKQKASKKTSQQSLLFYLIYGCGLRVSEVCGIRWPDFFSDCKKLKIKGKGGKERIAIVPPKSLYVLQREGDRQGPFIWGPQALPVRSAYQRIRDLGVAAGLLKPLHPHALRHSYATHLLTSGSDLRVLQQLMGHESLAATELYTHLDIDSLARSMEYHHPLENKK